MMKSYFLNAMCILLFSSSLYGVYERNIIHTSWKPVTGDISLWEIICSRIGDLQDERDLLNEILESNENNPHPLSGLRECSADKCPLNRTLSHHRYFLENFGLQSFHENHRDMEKRYTIIFYRSANLFWESLFLRRLADMHYASLDIICIDPSYKDLRRDGKSIYEAPIKWLLRDVGYTFYLYGSSEDYIKECEEGSIGKADCMIMVDFMERCSDIACLGNHEEDRVTKEVFRLYEKTLHKKALVFGDTFEKRYDTDLRLIGQDVKVIKGVDFCSKKHFSKKIAPVAIVGSKKKKKGLRFPNLRKLIFEEHSEDM